MNKLLLSLFCALIFTVNAFSQSVNTENIANTPVKSNLSYEALSQFFQSSVSVGRNGGFNFKSTLFGMEKLLSGKDLSLSEYYIRHKPARNTEFAIGVFKDHDGNTNLLQAGFKYALVNNRSKSDINFLDIPEIASAVQNAGTTLYNAEKIYYEEINRQKEGPAKIKKQKEFDEALRKYTKTQNIKDLPAGMQQVMDSLATAEKEGVAGIFHNAQELYDMAAKKIDLRGLLTIGFNPGYTWNEHRFDSSTLFIQYLKGFGNYKKPWNFDGQLRNYFLHDSTKADKNISRSIAVAIIGLNKTLVNDEKLNPILEFEIAFEYDYVHEGLYQGEQKNKISLDNTIRIHISNEIAVPLTLQFDLQHPVLSGFLKVDWNFEHDKEKK